MNKRRMKILRVTVQNMQEILEVDEEFLKKAVSFVLREEKRAGEISVVIIDDENITRLNAKYLARREPTDVLAFPMDSEGIIGDVAVSAPRAAEQAEEYGQTFGEELTRLVVHGTLHLLGYGDSGEPERQIMEERQEQLLEKIFSWN